MMFKLKDNNNSPSQRDGQPVDKTTKTTNKTVASWQKSEAQDSKKESNFLENNQLSSFKGDDEKNKGLNQHKHKVKSLSQIRSITVTTWKSRPNTQLEKNKILEENKIVLLKVITQNYEAYYFKFINKMSFPHELTVEEHVEERKYLEGLGAVTETAFHRFGFSALQINYWKTTGYAEKGQETLTRYYTTIRKQILSSFQSVLQNKNEQGPLLVVELGCGNAELLQACANFAKENQYKNCHFIGVDPNALNLKVPEGYDKVHLDVSIKIITRDAESALPLIIEYIHKFSIKKENVIFLFSGFNTRMVVDGSKAAQQLLYTFYPYMGVLIWSGITPPLTTLSILKKNFMASAINFDLGDLDNYYGEEPIIYTGYCDEKITEKRLKKISHLNLSYSAIPLEVLKAAKAKKQLNDIQEINLTNANLTNSGIKQLTSLFSEMKNLKTIYLEYPNKNIEKLYNILPKQISIKCIYTGSKNEILALPLKKLMALNKDIIFDYNKETKRFLNHSRKTAEGLFNEKIFLIKRIIGKLEKDNPTNILLPCLRNIEGFVSNSELLILYCEEKFPFEIINKEQAVPLSALAKWDRYAFILNNLLRNKKLTMQLAEYADQLFQTTGTNPMTHVPVKEHAYKKLVNKYKEGSEEISKAFEEIKDLVESKQPTTEIETMVPFVSPATVTKEGGAICEVLNEAENTKQQEKKEKEEEERESDTEDNENEDEEEEKEYKPYYGTDNHDDNGDKVESRSSIIEKVKQVKVIEMYETTINDLKEYRNKLNQRQSAPFFTKNNKKRQLVNGLIDGLEKQVKELYKLNKNNDDDDKIYKVGDESNAYQYFNKLQVAIAKAKVANETIPNTFGQLTESSLAKILDHISDKEKALTTWLEQLKPQLFAIDFDQTITSQHTYKFIDATMNEKKRWEAVKKILPIGSAKQWQQAFRQILANGDEIAIVTFNQYPSMVKRYLKEIIGLTPDELKRITVAYGAPPEGQPRNKNKHIERVMKRYQQDNQNWNIILVDDDKNNIQAAKEKHYQTIQADKKGTHIEKVVEFSNARIKGHGDFTANDDAPSKIHTPRIGAKQPSLFEFFGFKSSVDEYKLLENVNRAISNFLSEGNKRKDACSKKNLKSNMQKLDTALEALATFLWSNVEKTGFLSKDFLEKIFQTLKKSFMLFHSSCAFAAQPKYEESMDQSNNLIRAKVLFIAIKLQNVDPLIKPEGLGDLTMKFKVNPYRPGGGCSWRPPDTPKEGWKLRI